MPLKTVAFKAPFLCCVIDTDEFDKCKNNPIVRMGGKTQGQNAAWLVVLIEEFLISEAELLKAIQVVQDRLGVGIVGVQYFDTDQSFIPVLSSDIGNS